MEKRYIDTVRLLIESAPSVFEPNLFALKGGTAINLFVTDMPRLSVDLDLVFVDHRASRDEAISSIASCLTDLRTQLQRRGLDAEVVASGTGQESKLFIKRTRALVKVEVNHVFRGSVLPLETREMVDSARSLFATGLSVPTLAEAELYGSKLVAAMDRQHPRDLFDVHGLYAKGGLTPQIVDCFLCYLLGHNRPVHEVLFSRQKDLSPAFENEFAGLTRQPLALRELIEIRERLQRELPAALTAEHRRFLMSFLELQPDWTALPYAHLPEMPAIRWKLENLSRLKRSNPRKFAEQAATLTRRFEAQS